MKWFILFLLISTSIYSQDYNRVLTSVRNTRNYDSIEVKSSVSITDSIIKIVIFEDLICAKVVRVILSNPRIIMYKCITDDNRVLYFTHNKLTDAVTFNYKHLDYILLK